VTHAQLGQQLGIGSGKVQKILHEHLGVRRLCARWVPHLLTQEQKEALARLYHRRHDVMLLETLDHNELTLPFSQPQRLLGMEEEGKLDLDPRAVREAYLAELNSHITTIQQAARRYRYEHEVVGTSKDLGPPLSHFLARRAARLKKS